MAPQVSDQDASSARRARELKEAQQKRLEDGNDGNNAFRGVEDTSKDGDFHCKCNQRIYSGIMWYIYMYFLGIAWKFDQKCRISGISWGVRGDSGMFYGN